MLLKNALLTLFIVLTVNIYSQCDLRITGQIIDLDDGQELEDCLVSINTNTLVVATDKHGRFAFTGLCKGEYLVHIKHFGCRDTTIKIQLNKNEHLKVKLPHSAFELNEVDVMDKRVEMKQTQSRTDLTGRELDKTRGQTLGDALKNVSGVTTLNTGGTISKPMIHGMQGYRILIVNNGVRHEGQQWGNEHAPEIDPFIANKLSVIKGANAVRYGSDALGGVVLVEAPDLPDTSAITGEFNLVGATNGRSGIASGILQGNFEKLKSISWRVQGTYRKAGNINTPSYYLRNTGVEEYNFSYAISYHQKRWGTEVYYSQFNTKVAIFSGAHIGNLTDLNKLFTQTKPSDSLANFSYEIGRPYQQIGHELIKSKTHFHIANKWRLQALYTYQYNKRQEYDKHKPLNDSLAALNLPELDYRIQTQTGELFLEHDNIRSFRGQFGVNYMYQINNYFGRFFIPNYVNNTWGVFATERFVREHLEFELGVRYDEKYLQSYFYENKVLVDPYLKFNNVSWNAGAIYKPLQSFNLFVNVGSAWRSPAPNELYSNGIHHGVGAIERGNNQLTPEKVINVTLTGILQHKLVSSELTVYHNQFENFIFMNPANQAELTIKGAFPVFNYTQAKARISGVDFKSTINLTKNFTIIPKAMWLRAWNYTINDYLIYMPSDRYQLDAIYNFKLKKNEFYAQASYQHITKQWRVPSNTDFAPPPAGYNLIATEIGTTLLVGKQKLNISIAANNLLNQVYRDYLDRFRYYTDAQGRNFTLRLKMPLIIYNKTKNKEQ
jgi:iron complex outermembrane receptor protein